MDRIIEEIKQERARQDSKWGTQNHEFIFDREDPSIYYCIPTEEEAKNGCEESAKDGSITWMDIILEEFCEVAYAKSDKDRREELIQLCAVLVASIESLDRGNS